MYEYQVKEIVRVVDGDTVDVIIDLGFSLTKKERVRLAGIDAPESRTTNLEEKELGLDAKEFLERRLADCPSLKVQTEKDGKYGRMLGHFICGHMDINKEMVTRGFAWPYDGGSREKDLQALKQIRGII